MGFVPVRLGTGVLQGRGRAVAAVLVAAVVLTPAVRAAALDPGRPGKMSPRTAELWASGAERFRAVLHLATGPAARLQLAPPGKQQSVARLAAVTEAVGSFLDRLEGRLGPTDFVLRHAYRLRPAIAVDLSRRGLEEVLALPEVVRVEEAELWRAHSEEGLALIGADLLQASGVTGEGFAVAIVDTGVDYWHPTLGHGAIPNGVVLFGLDTADNDSDPMDCEGHGTAVASIAAGRPYAWDSFTRFAGGAAPGATILAYKASPDAACGTFDSRDVVAAIEDATLRRDAFNVVAINLSLGGEPSSGPCDGDGELSSYAAAVADATAAGIAVVASSGNEASSSDLDAPACLSAVISVASVYATVVPAISYCGLGHSGSCAPYLCQDFNVAPRTVTCYANTSPYLDLFAPSEPQTAAALDGEVTDFGGTSGAAPYVTGAIALLHQALPGMDPARARFLLELTGMPVTDPDNGVTRPLLDLETAVSSHEVAVGEGNVLLPGATGEPALSTAEVEADGVVAGLEVTVKVLHGRPEQLVITLISPEGTRVMLHDHHQGTSTSPLGAAGVWTTYPTETRPAESLDLFLDRPARGLWALEVVDTDPASAPGAAPRIVGWAMRVSTAAAPRPPQLSEGSFVVPIAARAPGAGGTFWLSDVRLLNPSLTDEAVVRVYLVPQGADGLTTFRLTSIAVPPRALLDLPDIVGGLLGADQAQGNLIFVTDAPHLLATSRTYNTGGAAGTYGQYVPMARPADGIGASDPPLVLLQLASNAAFRTNFGISETSGSPATVTVTLLDGATGALLGAPAAFTVESFSNLQVNNVFTALGAGATDNAYATAAVTGGNGRVVAYASVVDNHTGDAIFVPGSHPLRAASFMVPIVARAPGAQGTHWVSDLRLLDPGPSPLALRLEFRPEQGRSGGLTTATVTVGPAEVLAVDDVVGQLLGLDSAAGSLRVVPDAGEASLIVTSRTYNRTDHGTYGQFVPAVTTGFAGGDTVTLIHLDRNQGFRTNLGLCEVGGGTAELRYVLRDATGSTLGVGTATLGPYEVQQVNDLHAALGLEEASNTRVDLYMDAGDGAFTAYASVVDNLSGDAIFIPAARP